MLRTLSIFFFFFFNDTATTEIYTLSLHDALPISQPTPQNRFQQSWSAKWRAGPGACRNDGRPVGRRSEEHTSELQSLAYLVCRLLLEKKKTKLSEATHNDPIQTRSQKQIASHRSS